MPTNYAFIDSQNLNLSIRDQGWKLDWKRFRIYLKDKYNVQKAFLFLGRVEGQEKMYHFLHKVGFELIFKPIVIKQNGKIKGNCDTELVLHCAKIEYHNYDRAIIISGDGDFYSLVEFLIQKDKLLKIGIPDHKKYSSLLIGFRHPYFLYISKLQDKLEYQKKLKNKS